MMAGTAETEMGMCHGGGCGGADERDHGMEGDKAVLGAQALNHCSITKIFLLTSRNQGLPSDRFRTPEADVYTAISENARKVNKGFSGCT